MNGIEFLILGLATWRISSLLVQEDGPGDVFMRIRELAGISHDQNKDPLAIPDGFWPNLLSCVWCLSLWMATLIFIAYLVFPKITVTICTPFALSSTAIIVNRYS